MLLFISLLRFGSCVSTPVSCHQEASRGFEAFSPWLPFHLSLSFSYFFRYHQGCAPQERLGRVQPQDWRPKPLHTVGALQDSLWPLPCSGSGIREEWAVGKGDKPDHAFCPPSARSLSGTSKPGGIHWLREHMMRPKGSPATALSNRHLNKTTPLNKTLPLSGP